MAVIATGFFDGVHLGHRLVLGTLIREARARGVESVALSFWPHPRSVFQQEAEHLRLLTSPSEKRDEILSLGVDRYEVLDFSKEFSRITAGAFIKDVLIGKYGADAIVLGYDHRMGCDGLSTEQIAALASSLGLEVIRPPKSLSSGSVISSTRIRRSLLEGDVASAASMLGRPYTLSGVVVGGKHLGRTIGFPTANMRLYDPLKIIPAEGVYAVDVEVLGKRYRGMCNVAGTIETNIFDFDEDIYGLDIKISFLRRIRDEIQFNSLDLLTEQLRADRQACLLPLVLDVESKR